MKRFDDEPVRLGKGEVVAQTEKALRVRTKDWGTRWYPKSCFHDESEVWDGVTKEGQIVVKKWFAAKEKMV